MMNLLRLVVLFSALISAVSHAATDDYNLIGTAKLKLLVINVYESSLYSKTQNYAPKSTDTMFSITYLRSFSSAQIVKQTKKEWMHLGFDEDRIESWLTRLNDIFPDVNKKDEISLEVEPSGAHQFYFNSEPIGSVDDKEFAFAFLDIWFSENTSRPKLRKRLLKNAGEAS